MLNNTDCWTTNGSGERMTNREIEVAGLVSIGLTNKAVAQQLMVSEGTVKIHLHNIYRKLRVSSRAQLIVRSQFAA
jgi:DNA-binding NarL/FixJ family response regulator